MGNTVAYIFKAIDKYTQVGRKIIQNNKLIKKSSLGVAKAFDWMRIKGRKMRESFKSNFAQMGASVAAFITVSSVLGSGGKFQDHMAELSAITGAAGADLDAFGKGAMDMAKRFGTDQSVVVKSITDIASAKSELLKDPKGLMVITEQALLLSKAAGITVPEAVQASVGALNQFNVGADQAARFVNVLAAGSKVGASQVGEIVQAMKNAGSVASAFNVSFEETNALLQVLAKNGVKAAEAGTSIRGALSKLEGFRGGKYAPSKIGVIKSLEKIKELGLSNNEIIKDFGQENLRSILILRDRVPLIKQWTKEITGTNVAQEQANLRMNTFNSRVAILGTTLKGKLIDVFMGFEPVLSQNISDLTEWVDTINPATLTAIASNIKAVGSAFKFVVGFIDKGVDGLTVMGRLIGQIAGAVATLDFSKFDLESVVAPLRQKGGSSTRVASGITRDADLMRQIANVPLTAAPLAQAQNAATQNQLTGSQGQATNAMRADINLNLSAPQGAVDDIKTKTTGKVSGLNLGVNMETM